MPRLGWSAWSEAVCGMTAVADVIHQRSAEKRSASLHVVSAHRGKVHAFSCVNGTTLNGLIRKFRGKADYQEALKIAEMVCRDPSRLPHLVKSANHFSLATEHPCWAKGKKPVTIISKHAFCKL